MAGRQNNIKVGCVLFETLIPHSGVIHSAMRMQMGRVVGADVFRRSQSGYSTTAGEVFPLNKIAPKLINMAALNPILVPKEWLENSSGSLSGCFWRCLHRN